MTDMVELVEARRRMNLRRVLWFRCMDKVSMAMKFGTSDFTACNKALQVIAQAYAVSCMEVAKLEVGL